MRVAALWLKNESLAVGLRERESEAERLTLAPPMPELNAKSLVSLVFMGAEAEDIVDERACSLDIDLDLTSGAGGAGVGLVAKAVKKALVRLAVEWGLPVLSVGDPWRPYSDTPVGDGSGEMWVEGGASLPPSSMASLAVLGEFWTVSEPVPAMLCSV